MKNKSKYEKLARLAIYRGVNLQKGQLLVVRANLRDAEFVRMVVQQAYEAGAASVEVEWRDEEISRMHYSYQTKEELSNVPDWIHDREQYRHSRKACYLTILSDKPGSLKGVDTEKIVAYSIARSKKMEDLDAYTTANIGQWCVLGVPSMEWAKVIFPELDEEEAFDKLSAGIFMTSRVDDDTDPIENWKEHEMELKKNAEKMTAFNFQKLHFTSELGTDLTVKLVKDHIWEGGRSETQDGIIFDPNIPTEEIFCMPDRTGVDGIVYASKPLPYNGKVIRDFWFRFENGRVEDYGAKEGYESLKELLDFDEGSRHLGEVALVPYDSPVSNSGILFFNILYDENAACHLALGKCYPENIHGGTEMNEEELTRHGGNTSLQHVDFMFGTRKMSVDGTQEDGTLIPVFRNGNFVI